MADAFFLAESSLVGPDLDKRAGTIQPTESELLRANLAALLSQDMADLRTLEAAECARRVAKGTALEREAELLARWAGTYHEIALPSFREARSRWHETRDVFDFKKSEELRAHARDCAEKVEKIARVLLAALDAQKSALVERVLGVLRAAETPLRWKGLSNEEKKSALLRHAADTNSVWSLKTLASRLRLEYADAPASDDGIRKAIGRECQTGGKAAHDFARSWTNLRARWKPPQ